MHRKGKSKEDADEESGMKIKTVDGESESGDDYEIGRASCRERV